VKLLAIAAAAMMAGCCSAPPPTPAPAPVPAEPAPPRQKTPVIVEPPTPAAPEPSPLKELFPGIRIDVRARLVEFDGIVPVNCHDPATPDVYLELIACTPDTREHESLVMTRIKPSNLHAALLAVGVDSGKPGSWLFENKTLIPVPPAGDGVNVSIAYRGSDGREIECAANEWVVHVQTGEMLKTGTAGESWVFAGSVFAKRQGREVYDADGTGTVIGLCTFGSEVVAWHQTVSPEAMVNEPVWIANRAKVPAAGAPVVVRVRAR
jgi:hypothetical protein